MAAKRFIKHYETTIVKDLDCHHDVEITIWQDEDQDWGCHSPSHPDIPQEVLDQVACAELQNPELQWEPDFTLPFDVDEYR